MATKKKAAKVVEEPKANTANVIKMLELYTATEDKEELYPQLIADMYNKGEVSEVDILEMQGTIPLNVIMEICGNLKPGKSGYTFNQARELGWKMQFIGLSHAQLHNLDGQAAFRQTDSMLIPTIEAIMDGTYDETKLEILKALPSVKHWDHELGDAEYSKFFEN